MILLIVFGFKRIVASRLDYGIVLD